MNGGFLEGKFMSVCLFDYDKVVKLTSVNEVGLCLEWKRSLKPR